MPRHRSILTSSEALSVLALCIFAGAVSVPAAAAATLDVCPSGCTYSTIQTAVNAAAPGDTVAVRPGTYVENVVIDRPLTLRSVGTEHEGDDDTGRPIIVPAVSAPNPCSGSSLCGGAASNIILVQANDVTIAGLILDGDNPALTSGIIRGGVDLDARNGIITNHRVGTFNNLTVAGVTVRNVYLRGVYASSGGTFDFHANRVSNVQGDGNSVAMFNFGGSGVMARNHVSAASDAISSNWSQGVQFLDNIVTDSGSGVHTDNAGGFGTTNQTADLIQGNRVEHCQTDGYGIFVFVPYIAPTVRDNTVRGCTVGLAAFGQGAPVTTRFDDNTLSGASAPSSSPANSFGVIVTTDLIGFGAADVAASVTGNGIRHFNTGVHVEQHGELFGTGGGHASATLHDNVIKTNGTGAEGLIGTTVDATNNWWGCRRGPNHPGCDSATGTAIFTPWLTKPPRDDDRDDRGKD